MTRTPLTAPTTLLRLEGGARGGRWPLLAALLFAPDLSMLGYRAGRGAGAACYHRPLCLACYGDRA
jgi:hypothetical protein